MPQLDVICDLGIIFMVDTSWTSWTLDIEIVSAILVESDFSYIRDQFCWKVCLVLFLCICRMFKSDFVCVLYVNLKVRWLCTLSWT
jgi:hypothetical protein